MNYQEIDVYVALSAGLYRYEPAGHALCLEVPRDIRSVTGNQDFAAEAALDRNSPTSTVIAPGFAARQHLI